MLYEVITVYSGTDLSYNVTGNALDTTYYYRVRAIKDGYTNSSWLRSEKGCAVPGSGIVASPLILTVPKADADGAYEVSWRVSATPEANYILQEATDPTFTAGVRTFYPGMKRRQPVTGRSQDTTYYYRIKAIKAGWRDSAWRTGTVGCAVPGTTAVTVPAGITVPTSDAVITSYSIHYTKLYDWYNTEHQHSEIRFVTPDDRHYGREADKLKQRKEVYELARQKNPGRWTRQTRNWDPVETVRLNPERKKAPEEALCSDAA